jgi:predicted nucleic acid-binding protein
MKTNFPGYFKLTDEEVNSLWKNALFVFDANILLNLYRYSNETRDDFFKILDKVKDRIWIPHQSASEFFNNRLNVINQQEKSYEEAINSLKSIEDEFKNSRQHPFIISKLLKKFSVLSKEICEQLNDSKQFHNNRILQDDVLNKIEALFNEKVGDEYEKTILGEIYNEGEIRFLDKVPPGYKDNGKKDEGSKDVRKFGDLIVWKQIIDKSKELKQGIILVTDDRKEDWWFRFKGKTIILPKFRTGN